MDKVAEYERRSRECKELAAGAPTSRIRIHYLSLADTWLRLAEERRIFIQLKTLG